MADREFYRRGGLLIFYADAVTTVLEEAQRGLRDARRAWCAADALAVASGDPALRSVVHAWRARNGLGGVDVADVEAGRDMVSMSLAEIEGG